MPLQDQLPKLGPPVDLGVSAGPRPLERTPMTTTIASFDAPTIPVTNEPTNPVTTPVTPSTLYVEEPSTLYVNKPSTLYEPIEEPSITPVMASTPVNPDDNLVISQQSDNSEEPVTTPVMTSAPVDNPDDNLVIHPEKPVTPRHPDPRVKLGYLGIYDKPEEVKPPMVYGKIDGRIAQIMLDSGCSTYVLSTDFANAGNIPCFPCKPVPVELAVRNASQFTLNTQTKKLPMEVGNITQSKASYVLPLPSCDAIFGMPFLNDRKLVTYPEKGIVILDDIELPLVKDHDDERPCISMISRSRLKAEIRKNEITELYLATAKITNELDITPRPPIGSRTNTPTSSSTDYHLICHPNGKLCTRSPCTQIHHPNSEESFASLKSNSKNSESNSVNCSKTERLVPRQVPMEHRFSLQKRRMVAFECASITAH